MFILLLLVIMEANAANILVLEETLSPSHHLWFRALTTELTSNGHNVTCLTAEIDVLDSENLHFLHLEKVYGIIDDYGTAEVADEDGSDFVMSMGNLNPFIITKIFYDHTLKVCEASIESKGWQQLKNYPDDFKFDLVIHDFPSGICQLAFLHKFNNPPLVSMTAFNDFASATASIAKSAPILAQSHHWSLKNVPATFVERVQNFLLQLLDITMKEYYLYPKMNSLVRSSFSSLPVTLNELRHRTMLILLNYDAATDRLVQLPPYVIGVGGMQIRKPRTLSGDLQEIVNKPNDGLILFSLGTNIESNELNIDLITNVLKALKKLPTYTVLWKFDSTNLSLEIPENVFMRKWIPQNDLLAQNRTKLFITHAGLLSTQEAIWHGVPMLGLPIFGDQFTNIDISVKKGIAESLLLKNLTADSLYEKIQALLNNPKYKHQISVYQRQFRDQKETPLERAIWWIEWALRNPDINYFRQANEHLNFLQLQSIDVIVFLFVVITSILYISFKILKMCLAIVKSIILFIFKIFKFILNLGCKSKVSKKPKDNKKNN